MSLKTVLRSQVRKVLATALASSGPRPNTGTQLVQRLKNIPEYQNSKCVSIFLSMPSEVPTIDIISHAISSGKRVVVPKIIGPEPTDMLMIELSKLSDIDTFPKSKWGIPEPPSKYIASHPDLALSGVIDLVLVPGTAFDRRCGRLGQGKGYYGKFLSCNVKLVLRITVKKIMLINYIFFFN